jgi:RNA polymerase sigma-70 factor (sigma-E family)
VGEDFERYVAARYPALVTFAYAMTFDRHDAEDLAQTALLAALPRWASIETPDAYLRMTVARLVYRRSRLRKREVLVHVPPEIVLADATDTVGARQAILTQLGRLPARQRAVLVLRYLDDASDADIAAALGISLGAVRSQASRGLDKLRLLIDAPDLEVTQ